MFFHSGKEEVILRNNKGYFAIEAIAAFSVFLTVLLTLTPLLIQLKTEQEILSERRYIQSQLQGELLDYLFPSAGYTDDENMEPTDRKTAIYQFKEENNLVKGCAKWENAKANQETFCLYGKP